MYKDFPEKKDGAYTIFYMGVNAGAFFGMMLCGYLAEKVGWHWGFGLAGIFMLLGTLQFWLAKPLFGKIGEVPDKAAMQAEEKANEISTNPEDKRNPFTLIDKIIIAVISFIGIGYAFNDPLSKIGNIDIFSWAQIGEMSGQYVMVILGMVLLAFVLISRILRYTKVIRDRMIAVILFAFFTVFFWMSFEQGATSLVLFARDYTQRILTGGAATTFNIINTLLTVGPLAIISWVVFLLAKKTFKSISASNIVLVICFIGVWGVAGWMLNNDWSSKSYEVEFMTKKTALMDENGEAILNEDGSQKYAQIPVAQNYVAQSGEETQIVKEVILSKDKFEAGAAVQIHPEAGDKFVPLSVEQAQKINQDYVNKQVDSKIIEAVIVGAKDNQVEITASWFSILNSFFIIVFASFVSKIWESKYNPPASYKYGLGLIIMALGFGVLAYGSHGIEEGARVSMIWLVFAYLFHTLGELCLSPVGLSYVSKLVPGRMIAFMFGMWYLGIAIGNKLAAVLGGQIENITKEYSLSVFFLIFTVVPIISGLMVIFLNPVIKKLMHGVK